MRAASDRSRGQSGTSRSVKLRTGPAGVHVFNRSTGMNILLDEVRVARARWSRAPRSVSVALTNACDLNCPHCYAPKTPSRVQTSQLLRWIDELDRHGCLGVGLGGGEPTLFKELPRLCQYVMHETRMAVTMTTHGHWVDETLAAELVGNMHYIRLSMDGIAATYEELRGRPFAEFQSRVMTVREICPFGINFVVNGTTFKDLDPAIELAAEWGATQFLLLPQQPTPKQRGIDDDTARRLAEWVASYGGRIPLAVSENAAAGLPICDPFEGEDGLRSYAHIDAGGIMKRSSYASNGVPIGKKGVIHALESLRSGEVVA